MTLSFENEYYPAAANFATEIKPSSTQSIVCYLNLYCGLSASLQLTKSQLFYGSQFNYSAFQEDFDIYHADSNRQLSSTELLAFLNSFKELRRLVSHAFIDHSIDDQSSHRWSPINQSKHPFRYQSIKYLPVCFSFPMSISIPTSISIFLPMNQQIHSQPTPSNS